MSSYHYSNFSQTLKTKGKGKNKFQWYNPEDSYERKSLNTLNNKYKFKNYFRTDEKRNYLRQLSKSPKSPKILKSSKSPNSSYRKSTPPNYRKPVLKTAKKVKSIDKYFKHKSTFSFDQSPNGSFYSPMKNERSKEKANHKIVTTIHKNKKKDKKNQNLPKKYQHNRNQTIGNSNSNYTYTQKLLSPKKSVVQSPKKYELSLKNYSTQSNFKDYQSQTIKPYSKFSRNAQKPQSPTLRNQASTNVNLNKSTTGLPPKCKCCNNYLIEQKIYKRYVPKEEIKIFKTNSNLRSKSGKKSNLKKGKVTFSPKKKLYDTFAEEVSKVETTVKNNRYNPNYYIDEHGTSVFKEPIKTSTMVSHTVQNNQRNKPRYYNDAKVFGKKNNMAYYEINLSPQKKVYTNPIYI